MSITANYASALTVTEALAAGANPDAVAPSIVHSGFNTSKTLNAGSTPPASLTASFNKPLSSGTATIDLTALVGTNGGAVSLSGLRLQVLKVIAKSTNANPIVLTFGAANPYNLLGSAFVVSLLPGQEFLFYGNNAAPVVGSGAKNIDLSGTAAQSVDVIVVGG